jgi:fructose-1,6-bisphosphatase/inositol monophosphatase family enzyme
MNNLPANFLADTESAIREAGNLILKAYNLPVTALNVSKKATGWVTDVDLQVEKFYRAQLGKILPQANFLGEEIGGQMLKSGYVWVIDPIDGTYNFISKIPLFVTGVALFYQGEVIFSGVLEPVNGNYYWAYQDLAYLNNQLLKVQVNVKAYDGIIVLSSSASKYADLRKKFWSVRRFGCALLTQCWVASGKIACAVFNGIYYWDIAPSYLIMQNAGIKVDGFRGFDEDGLQIKYDIICASPEILSQIHDFKNQA